MYLNHELIKIVNFTLFQQFFKSCFFLKQTLSLSAICLIIWTMSLYLNILHLYGSIEYSFFRNQMARRGLSPWEADHMWRCRGSSCVRKADLPKHQDTLNWICQCRELNYLFIFGFASFKLKQTSSKNDIKLNVSYSDSN